MWVIDPLDGTVNFSRGIPLFGTSIAFVVEGEPQCGVIYLPMFDELFFAEKGKGAFCNDEPIRVSKTVDRHRAIVSVNDFNIGPAKLMKPLNKAQTELLLRISPKCMRIKNLGSASVELSFVASGRLDAYFMLWTNFWDVAAGSLIIAEAGGKATDYRGEAIKHDSRCLFFANEALYPDYLQILNNGGNLPHALDEVKTK